LLTVSNSCSWRLKFTKHYQDGYIRFATRKSVPSRWEFLWRENNETGMLVRRTVVIGTVEKYPTVELANAPINGFRLQLNSKRSRLTVSQPLLTISDLIDHYIQVELSPLDNWRSHATRKIYKYFLRKIRNIFSVIFNHAIRYEWLEQGKNPVTLVPQSATRRSDPQVLDYGRFRLS
jgi:integrase